MPKYVDVIIEKPTRDMWTKSLDAILKTLPGCHFGLKPVSIITKYYFDYSVFDNAEEEYCALAADSVSQKIAEALKLKERIKYGTGVYNWEDKDYKKLAAKVKKRLGKEYIQYIEPKLVLICEDKLGGTVDEVLELFKE